MLIEGDLFDISETIRNVTKDVLQEVMMEQNTVLGELRVQLQDLQVKPPQIGTMAPYVAAGTLEEKQMLRARITNTFVFPEGTLVVANEVDRAVVGRIKGLGLNLVALP